MSVIWIVSKMCKSSKTKKEGHDVVVVVSAMSGETNKLIEYAEHFSKNASRADMDI